MHDPLIVAAANHAEVTVLDSRGNTVQAWLLHATPSRVRVCFTNGTSGTIPRTHVRLTVDNVAAPAEYDGDTKETGPDRCCHTPPAPSKQPVKEAT
jgi:hypothetical protein